MTLAYHAIIVQTILATLDNRETAFRHCSGRARITFPIGLAVQMSVPGVSAGAISPRFGKR
jgi:hypothetical protein